MTAPRRVPLESGSGSFAPTHVPKIPLTQPRPQADAHLAALVSERLASAKAELLERMRAAGLTATAGWRVSEEVRHPVGGTVWTFRPIHSREPWPGFETSVAIDEEGKLVEGRA